ncbi:hypothetical protein MLD38_028423 [Melastoma candidum]|uniref:Uncharacterized protein n=1 Tax=Melastoma candidum TaxID=119954 RepID=A0ACB9N0Q5_9MYRT|nr:hypothetical protein MLD38_028423 [Melastoma candidum]
MGQPQPDPRASGGEWAAAVKLGSAEETGSAAAGSWGSQRLTWVAAGNKVAGKNLGRRGAASGDEVAPERRVAAVRRRWKKREAERATPAEDDDEEEVAGSSLVAESIRGRSWFSWLPGRVLAGADFGDGTVEEEELSSLAWSKRDWLGLAEACPCEVEVRCRQRIERTGTVVKFLRNGGCFEVGSALGSRPTSLEFMKANAQKLSSWGTDAAAASFVSLLLASCRLLACRCGSAGLPLQRRLTC